MKSGGQWNVQIPYPFANIYLAIFVIFSTRNTCGSRIFIVKTSEIRRRVNIAAMKRVRNLFLRVSPRSETELDHDGVFLRCAFEREKKFGAPKGGPPHECNSRARADALKREETAPAQPLCSLSLFLTGFETALPVSPPSPRRPPFFLFAVGRLARVHTPQLCAWPARHEWASWCGASWLATALSVQTSMHQCEPHAWWMEARTRERGVGDMQTRRNRKGMHERKRETELLCAEAARLPYVKRNVSIYSRVLQY